VEPLGVFSRQCFMCFRVALLGRPVVFDPVATMAGKSGSLCASSIIKINNQSGRSLLLSGQLLSSSDGVRSPFVDWGQCGCALKGGGSQLRL